MKKAKFLFAGFVALAVSASAEPTVSDVLVRQMWPWEGRIRVTFALANTGGNYTWVKNNSTSQVGNYGLTPGTVYYYKVRAYVDLPDGTRAYALVRAGLSDRSRGV